MHHTSELASLLRLVIMRVARRLRQEGASGISPSLVSALVSIERAGSLTLGELAAAEGIQPPSVTALVSQLAKSRLVRRVNDPADRRTARVSLTTRGKELLERNRERKNAFLAVHLRNLDSDDQKTLARAQEILVRLLEEES